MILPGFGVISEVLPVFARKPIFGYKAIAASTVGIASCRCSSGRTTCSRCLLA
jgi:heme/copper-type cytochrome/quinol oxidase subunit 1